MKVLFRIFFLFLIGFTQLVNAQHYNLRKFKTRDGLPGSVINAILKDSKNYIWVATQEGGICRFNGKGFTTYSNINGLHTNDVLSICEDAQGNIWIGTATGLSIFNGTGFTRIHEFGLDSTLINSIYKDRKNNLWIATESSGWIKYDGKKFYQFTTENGLPTNNIFCTLEDKEGNYWVGTFRNGLCKINSLSIKKPMLSILNIKDQIEGSKSVYSLMEDSKGVIWMGTTNAFVQRYENGKVTPLFYNEEVKTAFVPKMIEDENGTIWIATQENGLFKYNAKEFKQYDESEGFSSHVITALEFDNEHNLWVGTNGQGICVFKNEAFLNFNELDGLPNKQVSSFFELRKNLVLIGTVSGLCYYDGVKINLLNKIEDLKNQTVLCIAKDKENNIWIGTDNGIVILRESDFSFVRKIETLNGIEFSPVFGIVASDDGSMWVASSGHGLFEVNGEKINNYTNENLLLSNDVFTIYKAADNAIWIGYLKGGASRLKDGKITHFSAKNQLGDNTIQCITSNAKGQVFFGTSENGLYCYDAQLGFRNISIKQGLSSNVIISSLIDPKDESALWLGTTKGLNYIKIDAKFEVNSVKFYTEQNGLFGNELTENTLIRDAQNNIWIGGAEGFSIFNPTIENKNLVPPSLFLEDVRLYYQKVNWKNYTDVVDEKSGLPESLKLSYTNNHLTFDFLAISVDDEITYSYMLEGFDKAWSPPGKITEAIYSNIPSGKDYIFKVKAQNSDGVWSTKNIEFKFTIESPIWQRWWFISLSILLLLVSIFLYINWRTAKLAQEKKLLEDTVALRTNELKETNDQLSDAFKDIKDSINYAQKIQQSILPVDAKVKAALPDSFILFKPRDIVSGDFYWFGSVTIQGVIHHIVAAADCTGHGVPGAFMSMVGNTILNEIVTTKHIVNPSEILSQLHHGVKTALQQSENESRDGMDICLCCINTKTKLVLYAGAFNPLWILRSDGEMEIIKATKAAIGGFTPDNQVFETHQVLLNEGESIYLFTDGYADQFGGELGKKLTAKKFRDAILSVGKKSMKEQGFYLDNFFEIWKGKESQVDDILVIGIKV